LEYFSSLGQGFLRSAILNEEKALAQPRSQEERGPWVRGWPWPGDEVVSEQGKSETLRLDLRITSNDIFCANCNSKLGCPSNENIHLIIKVKPGLTGLVIGWVTTKELNRVQK